MTKKDAEMETDEGQGDFVKRGCIYEEFKEVQETRNIIASIKNIYGDQIAVEIAHERLLCGFWIFHRFIMCS